MEPLAAASSTAVVSGSRQRPHHPTRRWIKSLDNQRLIIGRHDLRVRPNPVLTSGCSRTTSIRTSPSDRASSSSTAAPVAPHPSGQAFDRILETLRRLKDDETLLVQSGKPVGVFRTQRVGAPCPHLERDARAEVGDVGKSFRALEASPALTLAADGGRTASGAVTSSS